MTDTPTPRPSSRRRTVVLLALLAATLAFAVWQATVFVRRMHRPARLPAVDAHRWQAVQTGWEPADLIAGQTLPGELRTVKARPPLTPPGQARWAMGFRRGQEVCLKWAWTCPRPSAELAADPSEDTPEADRLCQQLRRDLDTRGYALNAADAPRNKVILARRAEDIVLVSLHPGPSDDTITVIATQLRPFRDGDFE